MRIKIGEFWFDGKDQPVMVELTDSDKKNIQNMGELKRYCQFPDNGYLLDNITKWMNE